MLKVCPPCQNEYCFSTYFSWQVHQLGEASPGPARYNVQGELAKYLGEVHQVEENGFDPKIMGWEWLLRFVWYIYTYFSIVFIYLFIYFLFIYLYYKHTGRLLKVHDRSTLRTAHSLLVKFCRQSPPRNEGFLRFARSTGMDWTRR